MPWHIQRSGEKFCVVKGVSGTKGEQVKCHDTRDAAVQHMKALYASEKDASHIPALTEADFQAAANILAHYSDGDPAKRANRKGSRVRLYFSEGEDTPDGRSIDVGSINYNRPPPFPFRIQTRQPESGGHAGAELAGVLNRYFYDESNHVHVLEGPLDMKSDAGQLAERLIREGFLQTWSPDLGDVTWEEEVLEMDAEGWPTKVRAHVTAATMLGGTAVAIPALGSAVMELLDDDGDVVTPALQRGIAASVETDLANKPGRDDVHALFDGGAITRRHIELVVDSAKHPKLFTAALSWAPSVECFSRPDLTEPQRFTSVDFDTRRVFGHSALHGECHIGFQHRCVTIAEIADCCGQGNFEYATPGYVITEEGIRIPVGPLLVTGGHAPTELGWQQALGYYNDPANTVAHIVHGMDEFGVWFSGSLSPTATDEQVYTLLAHGVSLDARDVNGELRYLATCSVNVPGLPKLAARYMAASADAEPKLLTLVAAGSPPTRCPCLDDMDSELADLEFRVLTTRHAQ